ncbi:uncharacterized protein LOC109812632 [Cajanus cajan]|uniref:uncharacterized protein LOC109812632 n=1 Tax=Cajanus cajan TaxID=3821 RepID=UPI00098D9AAE|nr:uncharacterized protein LOC109812632 [Cajanus cajan]
MGIGVLTWFVFVSCIQAISSSEHIVANANPSKSHNVKTQDLVVVEKYGITKEAHTKIDLSHGSRTQRGKGAYGGADVNHHPTHNSASSSLPCISTLSAGLTLILLCSFYMCLDVLNI